MTNLTDQLLGSEVIYLESAQGMTRKDAPEIP